MTILHFAVLLLVLCAGTAVVFTRRIQQQVIIQSFFGLTLTILFVVLKAPGVALSAIVVGAVVIPLMYLLALAKIRDQELDEKSAPEKKEGDNA